jgi:GNAT superfamily N-acetyltransferase
MDAKIVLLTAEDIPQAMALKDALGWNQVPADWQRFLDLAPRGCFKAVVADRVVGTAVAFVFDRVCWIGMVIVEESFRRRGLGLALTRRCLEHSSEQGCRLCLLDATAGGVPLYAGLGFQSVGSVARATPEREGTPPDSAVRSLSLPSGGTLRPVTPTDLAAVAALEARAVGARREPLLRRLLEQRVAPGAPGNGLAWLDEAGSLRGFVLWRPGRHALQIGPLITAGSEAPGALLDGALAAARDCGQPPTLTVPADRREVTALLEARGLRVERRLTRMVLPTSAGERLRGEDQLIYAFSGPEKG